MSVSQSCHGQTALLEEFPCCAEAISATTPAHKPIWGMFAERVLSTGQRAGPWGGLGVLSAGQTQGKERNEELRGLPGKP